MRQLIFQDYVSLDGYAADANGELDFFETIRDQDDTDNLALLESIDTMLLGAETYRLFVAFWPTDASADEAVAARLNTLHKVVVSSTLDAAPWGSYEPGVVVRDLEAVRTLKATEGGDIVLWGSMTLFQGLLAAGLVDEVQLRVCPVLLGAGKPVFGDQQVSLELIEARPWAANGVLLRYRPQ